MSIALCVDCSENLGNAFDEQTIAEPDFEKCRNKILHCIDVMPEFFTWLPAKKRWFVTNVLQYYGLVETPVSDKFIDVLVAKLPITEEVEEADDRFYCPISYEIMTDPVFAEDGKIYERKNIEAHFKKSSRSPLCGMEIGHTLTPAVDLAAEISAREVELKIVLVENGEYEIHRKKFPSSSKLLNSAVYGRYLSSLKDNLEIKSREVPKFIDMTVGEFLTHRKIVFMTSALNDKRKLRRPGSSPLKLLPWMSIPHLYSQLYDLHDGAISGNLILYTESGGQIFSCRVKSMWYNDLVRYDVVPFTSNVNPNLLTKFAAVEQFVEIFRDKAFQNGYDVRLIAFGGDVREVDNLPVPSGKMRKLYDALDFAHSLRPEKIVAITSGVDSGSLLKYETVKNSVVEKINFIKLADFKVGMFPKMKSVVYNAAQPILYEFVQNYFHKNEEIENFSKHNSTMSRRETLRLMHEYGECLSMNYAIELEDNNIRKWIIDNGRGKLYIDFPDQWPNVAPICTTTNLNHPNVLPNGKICMTVKWSAQISAMEFIVMILELFDKPDIASIVDPKKHPLQ